MLLYYPIHSSGSYIYPVTIDYGFAAMIVLLYLVITRPEALHKKYKSISNSWIIFAIVAVIAGALGNLLFGFIETSNYLAISGAIANTSPIIITFLAWLVYKEKLTTTQVLGLFIAVLGAIIINIF